jgi:hypothetical protein
MGTNYFWIRERDVCKACGRGVEVERLHIGKSSAGWCFSLHIRHSGVDAAPQSLDDWKARFVMPCSHIEDEYGRRETAEAMVAEITERSNRPRPDRIPDVYGCASWAEFFDWNHAEPGPNNLLRHRIEPDHCVGHGEGTWDLIIGEFS